MVCIDKYFSYVFTQVKILGKPIISNINLIILVFEHIKLKLKDFTACNELPITGGIRTSVGLFFESYGAGLVQD